MAKTKDPTNGTGENISADELVEDEILSNEDVAQSDIYGKSAEEANADDNTLKDIQADESKEESDAETTANEQLGPEITGAKPKASKSSIKGEQPTNVLERQEKAEEGLGYPQPAISEIEEETVMTEELKSKKKAQKKHKK